MKSHLTRDAVAGAVRFRPGAARTARVSMRVRIRRSPIPVGTMSKHSFLAICRWAAALAAAFAALPAHASFLSGEALDKAADIIAIVVLIVVPVVGLIERPRALPGSITESVLGYDAEQPVGKVPPNPPARARTREEVL